MGIIVLACIGSIYSAVTAIAGGSATSDSGGGDTFLFLKMYTLTSSSLAVPSFATFLSWLGPLIGITLGFDAVNSERNKGTLGRLLSQPIYRDDFIKAKFVSSLFMIGIVVFSLGFLVMGLGLMTIGYPPTPEEFGRILIFLLIAVVYIGFWLCLSILFSIRFRQAATSALSSIAVWLFFTIFYSMIINMIDSATAVSQMAAADVWLRQMNFVLTLNRLSPTEPVFGDDHNDALPRRPLAGAADDGSAHRGDRQPVIAGAKPAADLAATHRFARRHDDLLRPVLRAVHAPGSAFESVNLEQIDLE